MRLLVAGPVAMLVAVVAAALWVPAGSAQAAATCAAPADIVDGNPDRTGTTASSADAVTGFPQIELVTGCFQEDANAVFMTITTATAPNPNQGQTWVYTAGFKVGTTTLSCTFTVGPTTTRTVGGCTGQGVAAAVTSNGVQFQLPKARIPVAAGDPLTDFSISSRGTFVNEAGSVLVSQDSAPTAFAGGKKYLVGTRAPATVDSDGDGIPDRDEIAAGTHPSRFDTDYDGLLDGVSVTVAKGSPADLNFTNAGGIIALDDGTNVTFAGEVDFGTNATRADTDGDGILDGGNRTVAIGGDAAVLFLNLGLQSVSSDGTVETYLGEFGFGANPTTLDTDADGLTDFEEIFGTRNEYKDHMFFLDFPGSTSVLLGDTDGDGLTDFEETSGNATAPDGAPLTFPPTNPNLADTDGDFIPDRDELLGQSTKSNGEPVTFPPTDPTLADSDGDGHTDQGEIESGSDPRDPTSVPVARVEDEGPQEAELSYFFLSTVALLVIGLLSIVGILVRWG